LLKGEKMRRFLGVSLAICLSVTKADPDPDPTTLTKKLLFGYQGWFDTPNSGSTRDTWVHWAPGVPTWNQSTFDLWPATDEYEFTVPTENLSNKDGNLKLFSSFSKSTTDLHFQWMHDYGIDGVYVQRFVTYCIDGPNADKDVILQNAIAAAEKTNRVISIMYDISGAAEDKWADALLNDWKHIVEDFNVTASPSWLHHNGKPVMSIWGIGFTDHPGTPDSSKQLLSDLNDYTPITFVGGVPTHWRESTGDSKPGYESTYALMDVISPWLVGRFDSTEAFDSYMNNVFIDDAAQTASTGQSYAPVIFPGFSWANLQRTKGGSAEFNQIPRDSGTFWSHQANAFRDMDNEPLFIYGAMFDEVDEGTAMFKVVSTKEETPDAPAQFLYLNVDDGIEVAEDFYLSLAGNFTRDWRASSDAPSKKQSTPKKRKTWSISQLEKRAQEANEFALRELEAKLWLTKNEWDVSENY